VEGQHQARRLLWMYAGVLLLYAALASWWVYFFFNQADWVVAHVRSAGGDLTAPQVEVLREVTARTARMFLMESGFLFLLLAGSALFVLRALRREAAGDVPVLLLTARREESDKVLGLESGADDYLTKPFGVRELVARARALTRRPRAGAAAPAAAGAVDGRPVRLGPLVVDPARRSVTVDGREVELTGREFDLLHLLASHPGIVFSREALVQRVWRGDTFVTARNIDTLVKRLRQKVESNPSEPALILTVWGAGYKAADV